MLKWNAVNLVCSMAVALGLLSQSPVYGDKDDKPAPYKPVHFRQINYGFDRKFSSACPDRNTHEWLANNVLNPALRKDEVEAAALRSKGYESSEATFKIGNSLDGSSRLGVGLVKIGTSTSLGGYVHITIGDDEEMTKPGTNEISMAKVIESSTLKAGTENGAPYFYLYLHQGSLNDPKLHAKAQEAAYSIIKKTRLTSEPEAPRVGGGIRLPAPPDAGR